jgi:dihydroorotate dehydrogenase electron transfer subunit
MQDPTSFLLDRHQLGRGFMVRAHMADAGLRCRPGQFFLLRCGPGWTVYLRRPLFPAGIEQHSLAFWGDPAHDAAIAWLLAQPDGSPLDLIGPLGNGYAVRPQHQRLLLLAQAPHLASLLALVAPQLARQGSVGLLLEAPTAAELLVPAALPPAVEYVTATADGSAGETGHLVEALVRGLAWADLVCVAGTADLMRRLRDLILEAHMGLRHGFVQALAPVSLACGVGACLSCLVESGTRHGWHRACVRGPVFDLVELAL